MKIAIVLLMIKIISTKYSKVYHVHNASQNYESFEGHEVDKSTENLHRRIFRCLILYCSSVQVTRQIYDVMDSLLIEANFSNEIAGLF